MPAVIVIKYELNYDQQVVSFIPYSFFTMKICLGLKYYKGCIPVIIKIKNGAVWLFRIITTQ